MHNIVKWSEKGKRACLTCVCTFYLEEATRYGSLKCWCLTLFSIVTLKWWEGHSLCFLLRSGMRHTIVSVSELVTIVTNFCYFTQGWAYYICPCFHLVERIWPWNSGQAPVQCSLASFHHWCCTVIKFANCFKYVKLFISKCITTLICTICKKKEKKCSHKDCFLNERYDI